MPTGKHLVTLAEDHIGEKYENIRVPKDNPHWRGPWDCAEFVTWVVFQKTGTLYGCTSNTAKPALAEAYSGAWVRDAANGTLLPATEDQAVNTPGLVLVRKPPLPGHMGHVALSDGQGKTVEAAGRYLGVRRGKVRGRVWHHIVKMPGVDYTASNFFAAPVALPVLLTLEQPNLSGPLVRKVQQALKAQGFNPGVIDGEYGPHTVAAVSAFQLSNRLVADGIVGPRTARRLGLDWPEVVA
jgi:N-acetylmuramoyl-L-alanine amidase